MGNHDVEVYSEVVEVLDNIRDNASTYLLTMQEEADESAALEDVEVVAYTDDQEFIAAHVPSVMDLSSAVQLHLRKVVASATDGAVPTRPGNETIRTFVTRKLGDVLERAHAMHGVVRTQQHQHHRRGLSRLPSSSTVPDGRGRNNGSESNGSGVANSHSSASAMRSSGDDLRMRQLLRLLEHDLEDTQRLIGIAFTVELNGDDTSASTSSGGKTLAQQRDMVSPDQPRISAGSRDSPSMSNTPRDSTSTVPYVRRSASAEQPGAQEARGGVMNAENDAEGGKQRHTEAEVRNNAAVSTADSDTADSLLSDDDVNDGEARATPTSTSADGAAPALTTSPPRPSGSLSSNPVRPRNSGSTSAPNLAAKPRRVPAGVSADFMQLPPFGAQTTYALLCSHPTDVAAPLESEGARESVSPPLTAATATTTRVSSSNTGAVARDEEGSYDSPMQAITAAGSPRSILKTSSARSSALPSPRRQSPNRSRPMVQFSEMVVRYEESTSVGEEESSGSSRHDGLPLDDVEEAALGNQGTNHRINNSSGGIARPRPLPPGLPPRSPRQLETLTAAQRPPRPPSATTSANTSASLNNGAGRTTVTTSHMQRLPGELWGHIVDGQLARVEAVLRADVVDLFNYGEATPILSVHDVDDIHLSVVGTFLYLRFRLRHPRALTESEINMRLSLCSYPSMSGLYDEYFKSYHASEFDSIEESFTTTSNLTTPMKNSITSLVSQGVVKAASMDVNAASPSMDASVNVSTEKPEEEEDEMASSEMGTDRIESVEEPVAVVEEEEEEALSIMEGSAVASETASPFPEQQAREASPAASPPPQQQTQSPLPAPVAAPVHGTPPPSTSISSAPRERSSTPTSASTRSTTATSAVNTPPPPPVTHAHTVRLPGAHWVAVTSRVPEKELSAAFLKDLSSVVELTLTETRLCCLHVRFYLGSLVVQFRWSNAGRPSGMPAWTAAALEGRLAACAFPTMRNIYAGLCEELQLTNDAPPLPQQPSEEEEAGRTKKEEEKKRDTEVGGQMDEASIVPSTATSVPPPPPTTTTRSSSQRRHPPVNAEQKMRLHSSNSVGEGTATVSSSVDSRRRRGSDISPRGPRTFSAEEPVPAKPFMAPIAVAPVRRPPPPAAIAPHRSHSPESDSTSSSELQPRTAAPQPSRGNRRRVSPVRTVSPANRRVARQGTSASESSSPRCTAEAVMTLNGLSRRHRIPLRTLRLWNPTLALLNADATIPETTTVVLTHGITAPPEVVAGASDAAPASTLANGRRAPLAQEAEQTESRQQQHHQTGYTQSPLAPNSHHEDPMHLEPLLERPRLHLNSDGSTRVSSPHGRAPVQTAAATAERSGDTTKKLRPDRATAATPAAAAEEGEPEMSDVLEALSPLTPQYFHQEKSKTAPASTVSTVTLSPSASVTTTITAVVAPVQNKNRHSVFPDEKREEEAATANTMEPPAHRVYQLPRHAVAPEASTLGNSNTTAASVSLLQQARSRQLMRDGGGGISRRDPLPTASASEVAELTEVLASFVEHELGLRLRGLVVEHVRRRSPAYVAGMQAGDTVRTLDAQTLGSAQDFYRGVVRHQQRLGNDHTMFLTAANARGYPATYRLRVAAAWSANTSAILLNSAAVLGRGTLGAHVDAGGSTNVTSTPSNTNTAQSSPTTQSLQSPTPPPLAHALHTRRSGAAKGSSLPVAANKSSSPLSTSTPNAFVRSGLAMQRQESLSVLRPPVRAAVAQVAPMPAVVRTSSARQRINSVGPAARESSQPQRGEVMTTRLRDKGAPVSARRVKRTASASSGVRGREK